MTQKLNSLVETIQDMSGKRKDTLYSPQNTISKMKHFGGIRMIWGFPSMDTEAVHIIEGTTDSVMCCKIWKKHDNDTKYTAVKMKKGR